MDSNLSDIPPITPKRQRLADQVYDALCNLIIDNKLAPGQRLREAEVADVLEVSRTPVREAFARLEQQHLLERDASGRYFVARWDKRTLWEVATLRGALEGLAASLVSETLSPEDFHHLEGIIMQMEANLGRGDSDRLISLDFQFHSYLWSRTRHEILRRVLEERKAQVLYFMCVTKPNDEANYPETHRQLLEVLREGNPRKASEAIAQHVLETAERADTSPEQDE